MSNENRLPSGVRGGGRWTHPQRNTADGISLGGPVPPGAESVFTDIGSLDIANLRRLVESPDALVRAELTSSPRVPDDVLERLAEHDQPAAVRLAAAQTGYAGTGDRAAADPNPLVRAMALAAWDLSPENKEAIGNDRSVQKVIEALRS